MQPSKIGRLRKRLIPVFERDNPAHYAGEVLAWYTGKPLFKPRRAELIPISWEDRHRDQRLLYDAVTEHVREGYNRAIAEKRNYIGFLMILLQRLVVISTRTIRTGFKKAWQEHDYATIIAAVRKIPENVLREGPKLLVWYDQAVTRSEEDA